MVKLTFSLDDSTVRLLKDTAERSRKPQSAIVREAIAHYAAREDILSAGERDRLLGALREIKRRPPTRPTAEVDRELRDIRRSRRTGWSRPVR
jgi:predicted transcriptional regulator